MAAGWVYPDGTLQSVSDYGKFADIGDHATLGCFLALVREAHGSPHMHLARCNFGDNSGWWLWYDRDGDRVHQAGRGRTENEAHIVALEAAPELKTVRLPGTIEAIEVTVPLFTGEPDEPGMWLIWCGDEGWKPREVVEHENRLCISHGGQDASEVFEVASNYKWNGRARLDRGAREKAWREG